MEYRLVLHSVTTSTQIWLLQQDLILLLPWEEESLQYKEPEQQLWDNLHSQTMTNMKTITIKNSNLSSSKIQKLLHSSNRQPYQFEITKFPLCQSLFPLFFSLKTSSAHQAWMTELERARIKIHEMNRDEMVSFFSFLFFNLSF